MKNRLRLHNLEVSTRHTYLVGQSLAYAHNQSHPLRVHAQQLGDELLLPHLAELLDVYDWLPAVIEEWTQNGATYTLTSDPELLDGVVYIGVRQSSNGFERIVDRRLWQQLSAAGRLGLLRHEADDAAMRRARVKEGYLLGVPIFRDDGKTLRPRDDYLAGIIQAAIDFELWPRLHHIQTIVEDMRRTAADEKYFRRQLRTARTRIATIQDRELATLFGSVWEGLTQNPPMSDQEAMGIIRYDLFGDYNPQQLLAKYDAHKIINAALAREIEQADMFYQQHLPRVPVAVRPQGPPSFLTRFRQYLGIHAP